jgi:hypothetical protein
MIENEVGITHMEEVYFLKSMIGKLQDNEISFI